MTAVVRSARTMTPGLGLTSVLVMVACVGLPAASGRLKRSGLARL